jgi:hypothetical protein
MGVLEKINEWLLILRFVPLRSHLSLMGPAKKGL